jgi:response regulator RpfG family c-di-GMP phosphodiesterase/tRNA A-37 threonylcarbamoyl transferase component Bud32
MAVAPLPRPARTFLEKLVQIQLLDSAAVSLFLQQYHDRLAAFLDLEMLGDALVDSELLTPYQLNRIRAGTTHGLVLGSYRVRDRLGGGGVGVVFLGEHVLLRRRVAIKVVPVDDHFPAAILDRFHSEMRVLAEMQHPHVVLAYDAGRLLAPSPKAPALHYLVMELLSGGDLEQFIDRGGPAPVSQSCEWIRQAASGLQESHDRHLIHRDLKPSNMLLTADNQVKLVDFGLARQFTSNRTDPRALLGSLDFMAPEQSIDASAVGPAADIYGLGATLFWLLTADAPYPSDSSVAKALYQLQFTRPRRVRDLKPELPQAIDDLVERMLARDPAKRPSSALSIMPILARFANEAGPSEIAPERRESICTDDEAPDSMPDSCQVLVVACHPNDREAIEDVLKEVGCKCQVVETVGSARSHLELNPCDAILIGDAVEGCTPLEIVDQIRGDGLAKSARIILIGQNSDDAVAEALLRGADDFLSYPVNLTTLAAKVQQVLRIKDASDRASNYIDKLLQINRQLHGSLAARDVDVQTSQDALLFAMSKLAESRDGEGNGHLRRITQYAVSLAQALKSDPAWKPIVDEEFLRQLERCAPLHDIGKLALPDQILLKPSSLTPDERRIMQQHTVIGSNMLEAIGNEYGESLDFLGVARSIVRHHHERFDGQGYPDGLREDEIPAAARLVSLADVYDALRRKRPHKPALSHTRAADTILREMAAAFDPAVLRAFAACHERFQRIFLAVVS